jgi:hypothetical protein
MLLHRSKLEQQGRSQDQFFSSLYQVEKVYTSVIAFIGV